MLSLRPVLISITPLMMMIHLKVGAVSWRARWVCDVSVQSVPGSTWHMTPVGSVVGCVVGVAVNGLAVAETPPSKRTAIS